MKAKYSLPTLLLITVLASASAHASGCTEKDKTKCPPEEPKTAPRTHSAQRASHSQGSRRKKPAPAAVTTSASSAAADATTGQEEGGENEFNIVLGNGIVGKNLHDSQTYGIEATQAIGHQLTVDGEFSIVRESSGARKIDDARLGLTRAIKLRGHEVGVGLAGEQNLTIDATTKIAGVELSTTGPLGVELISGAYTGNINIDGVGGGFKMIRVGGGRDFKIRGREISVWHWQDLGRTAAAGDRHFLGQGVYSKKTTEIELPFETLSGGLWKNGAFVYALEDKKTYLGGEGETERQHTIELNYPVGSLVQGVKKGVRAISGK